MKEANKGLQVDLAAVKRDRDECVKSLQANSISPIFYASTQVSLLDCCVYHVQKRDEFWKIIHENIAFLREKNKYENDTQSKLYNKNEKGNKIFREEKDDEILKQRIMIEHLRKEVANNKAVHETNEV